MNDATELSEKMRARATADGLPSNHDLYTLAEAFDNAIKNFYSEPQTCSVGKFMGCWARARRAWCDYTGESLI